MKKPETPLAPRQDRSRASVERLLNATLGLLDREGLDAAVIPRIAAEAGMAPANLYRRFVDKQALLRAAFLLALEQSNVHNREAITAQVEAATLAGAAGKLVSILLAQYQAHPHFLRALSRFIDEDSDQAFIATARGLIGANVDLLVAALLVHRKAIAHEPPAPALRFAVLSASCSIETFALDPGSIWHVAPAISVAELKHNLVRSFVSYLTTPLAE